MTQTKKWKVEEEEEVGEEEEGFKKDADGRLERTVKEEMKPKIKSSEESRHSDWSFIYNIISILI